MAEIRIEKRRGVPLWAMLLGLILLLLLVWAVLAMRSDNARWRRRTWRRWHSLRASPFSRNRRLSSSRFTLTTYTARSASALLVGSGASSSEVTPPRGCLDSLGHPSFLPAPRGHLSAPLPDTCQPSPTPDNRPLP